MLVFGLGILIVYLVLSAQYESYVTPVIILMTVPLAMLGALAFLAIRSIDLNIYAQVGLITLIGLAGFLPLVVANGAGAQSQQSLGTVIFGGLVVATVLSLGVVPPFYVVVKALERRWFGAEESHAS